MSLLASGAAVRSSSNQEKIGPRLLGELGGDRARFPSAEALQCHAGTAPAFFQSGQIRRVYLRRALGQRWLKILWKMWQTRRPYDAELHQRNQAAHGSWVLSLNPKTA